MTSFGTIVNPDGDQVTRDLPIQFLTALPAAGEFVGDMVSLTTGSVGLYVWNGAAWVGPLGAGGGGGGAPTTVEYLVGAADGGLSAERVVTSTSTVAWDLGTAAQAKANVPDAAITYAKIQNVSAISRLLGRGSAAGVGPPVEVTLGTNLSMSGTTLNAAGGATPTGTGFRHVTGGVEDAATKLVDTADVNDAQITYPKLQDVSAAERLLGRGAGASGDVQELSVGAGLTFSGTTLRANASGASFPVSPVEGDLFYRTDHGTLYFWRAASARWLSVQIHEVLFGATNSIATNTYFYTGMGTGFARYTNTLGHLFGFSTQVVGIACRFSTPVTCVLQVTQSGANVASATLTYTAQANKTREDFFPAAVIPVDAPIGVKNTGGATGTSTCIGKIRLRRSEV